MSLLSNLLDIIYPQRCHICMDFLDDTHRENPDLCNTCFTSFKDITHPFCSICGIPFKSKVEEDHLCEKCLVKRPFYDEIRAPYLYEESLMKAIQRMKYSGKSYIVKSVGPLLGIFAKKWINDITEDMIIIPVPLHKKRLKQRGFNQSVLLAKVISPMLSVETDFFTLKRIKHTDSQTGLNLKQRKKNMKGAFEVSGKKNIKDKKIILVDDVATTGNTINECARVLKKAGCKKVSGLVLARTPAY